jgi:hypothetical protein
MAEPTLHDDLFFMTRGGMKHLGALPGYALTSWGKSCNQVKGFLTSRELALKKKMLVGLLACHSTESIEALLYQLWDQQFTLAALKALASFFGYPDSTSKASRLQILTFLVRTRAPYLNWDQADAHMARLRSMSPAPTVLNLALVHAAFVEDTGVSRPSHYTGLGPSGVSLPSATGDHAESKYSDDLELDETFVAELAKIRAVNASLLSQQGPGVPTAAPRHVSFLEPSPGTPPLPPVVASAREAALLARLAAVDKELVILRAAALVSSGSINSVEAQAGSQLGARLATPTVPTGILSPLARLNAELDRLLLAYEYIEMIFYSQRRLDLVEMTGTRRRSTNASLRNGQLSFGNADDDDVATLENWNEYRSGFHYVVTRMFNLESRRADGAMMLRFMSWLESTCPVSSHQLLRYARLCGLRYKESRDWIVSAKSDVSTILTCVDRPHSPPSACISWAASPTARSPPPQPAPQPTAKRQTTSLASPAPQKKAAVQRGGKDKFPPPGEPLSLAHPGDTCLSRISKDKSCPRELAGIACRFDHTCAKCPGQTHPMSECPDRE